MGPCLPIPCPCQQRLSQVKLFDALPPSPCSLPARRRWGRSKRVFTGQPAAGLVSELRSKGRWAPRSPKLEQNPAGEAAPIWCDLWRGEASGEWGPDWGRGAEVAILGAKGQLLTLGAGTRLRLCLRDSGHAPSSPGLGVPRGQRGKLEEVTSGVSLTARTLPFDKSSPSATSSNSQSQLHSIKRSLGCYALTKASVPNRPECEPGTGNCRSHVACADSFPPHTSPEQEGLVSLFHR